MLPELAAGFVLAVMGLSASAPMAWPPRISHAAHRAPPTRPDGALDKEAMGWYLSGIGPMEQLDSTAEVRLSIAVRTLSRWEKARKQLRAELGRAPSTAEWAAAASLADMGAGDAQVLDVEELSATVYRHQRFAGAGLRRPTQPDEEEAGPLKEPSSVCARSFKRQLELMRQAREVMITHNLKLVVAVAKGYANRGVNLQDLIQEGTFGLISAVEKFDPAHSCRFSTYAHYWINLSVSRAVSSSSRLIRLPVHAGVTLSKVKRVRAQFYSSRGRPPSTAELAKATEVPQAKLEMLLKSDRDPISLDKARFETGSRDDQPWVETIPDSKLPPEEQTEASLRRQALEAGIHSLEPAETQIMLQLYPREGGGRRLPTKEVAERLGWKTNKVRRVEQRALSKLRAKRQLKDLYLQLSNA
ncbi:hypothetical protein AB1Y20_014094 [Prymnesium parvum]|uniref:RNA polymerase sigma-70 domain-containing protein n=1 Tax=Prymnesium parvum TaxID=97485 RepID=A0AB34IH64_PRYPA